MQKVRIKSLTDNKMTFFSGTDTATLQEEGSYKNNFVSLIVNNAGTYTAAITRHVYSEDTVSSSFTYEMFGNGPVTGNSSGIKKSECIEYFMMNVIKPVLTEQSSLDDRINEIYDKKRAAAAAAKERRTWKYYADNNAETADSYTSDELFGETKVKKESEDTDHRQMTIPWEESEYHTYRDGIKEGPLRVTLARILTSSMTSNEFNIDIQSWIDNYDRVYGAKFGNIVDYSDWLAPYLEYVMYHIPGLRTDIVDDIAVAVYANAIIDKIGKPKGAYTKELIDQLTFYGTV